MSVESETPLRSAVSSNFGVLAIQLALRVGTLALLAVILGPNGQGHVAFATVIATVGAGVAGVGLEIGLMQATAREHSREEAYGVLWTHMAVVAVVSALVVSALEATGSASRPVVAGLVALPALLFTRLAASCALGQGRRKSFAMLSLGPFALYAATILTFAVAGALDVRTALDAFIGANVLAAVALGIASRRWLRPRLTRGFWRTAAFRTSLRVFPGFVATLTSYRFDQLLIGVLMSSRSLGLYSLAVAASEATTLPAQATSNVLLPRVTRGAPGSEPSLRTPVLAAAGAAVAAAPLAVALSPLLPAYRSAVPLFLLLVPGAAAIAGSKVAAAVTVGKNRPWSVSTASMAGCGAAVVLDLALIPLAGTVGAAIAASAAYAVTFAMMIRAATRTSRPPVTAPSLAREAVG